MLAVALQQVIVWEGRAAQGCCLSGEGLNDAWVAMTNCGKQEDKVHSLALYYAKNACTLRNIVYAVHVGPVVLIVEVLASSIHDL